MHELSRLVHSTSPAPAAPRARVAGGAEEPLLARHIRSSKRRRQDAYATPRRRRMRTRSRRLSLRLRERLCSPARTPRCRSSSIGEEIAGRGLVPARTMRATVAECLLRVTSQAIRKHLRDRGVGAGVAPEFMAKRDSELVGIRGRGPPAPSVSRRAWCGVWLFRLRRRAWPGLRVAGAYAGAPDRRR